MMQIALPNHAFHSVKR